MLSYSKSSATAAMADRGVVSAENLYTSLFHRLGRKN